MRELKDRPNIVIVGAGFAGLAVARSLASAKAQVTVIDKSNHHLFQPLLYQVASAGLSPADITSPIRAVLKKQANTQIYLTEVTAVDLSRKTVNTQNGPVVYDFLVIATGSEYNYFGHDDWKEFAPSLKTLRDATTIRNNILMAFEKAEMEKNPETRAELLTFVLIGAGPTGVEMAGAIAELSRHAMKKDFRNINPNSARIILIEASNQILPHFKKDLSDAALKALGHLGVEVKLGSRVIELRRNLVVTATETIRAANTLWTAGVLSTPVGKWLNLPTDNMGRVDVTERLTLPSNEDVYVIGDAARFIFNGSPLPGLASVAQQEGYYVGNALRRRLQSRPISVFLYHDKGILATVGRKFAIAQFRKIQITGFVGWMVWLTVHIYQLIGFRNRLVVATQWIWGYLTFQRGARLIP